MMWVIRAGQNSLYFDKFIENNKVYIPWNGYHMNLSAFPTRTELRTLVEKEKGTVSRTSVSNWAGQLFCFVNEIKKKDLVLIPSKGSRTYCVARISGDYMYDESNSDGLYHSRDISILLTGVPREIFSQEIIYSLGAFRTIFKAHHEEEIIRRIKSWKEKHG